MRSMLDLHIYPASVAVALWLGIIKMYDLQMRIFTRRHLENQGMSLRDINHMWRKRKTVYKRRQKQKHCLYYTIELISGWQMPNSKRSMA